MRIFAGIALALLMTSMAIAFIVQGIESGWPWYAYTAGSSLLLLGFGFVGLLFSRK